jgi:hypothetical protein
MLEKYVNEGEQTVVNYGYEYNTISVFINIRNFNTNEAEEILLCKNTKINNLPLNSFVSLLSVVTSDTQNNLNLKL